MRPGSLPFKIAQLEVGESTFIECGMSTRRSVINRVELATKAAAISHMRFESRPFHSVAMDDPSESTCIVKITRLADKEPG